MLFQCEHCAQEISLSEDGRRPPWCPKCGGDLKPGGASPAPLVAAHCETRARTRPDGKNPQAAHGPSRSVGEPWDERSCFSCGTPLAVAEAPDDRVAYCPECGQCLK